MKYDESGWIGDAAFAEMMLMRKMSEAGDRPDLIAVTVVQELADIVARSRDKLPMEDIAVLIGIGSILWENAQAEINAMFDAFGALRKARGS